MANALKINNVVKDYCKHLLELNRAFVEAVVSCSDENLEEETTEGFPYSGEENLDEQTIKEFFVKSQDDKNLMVLLCAIRNGKISNTWVQDQFGMTYQEAKLIIDQLVVEGFLVRKNQLNIEILLNEDQFKNKFGLERFENDASGNC